MATLKQANKKVEAAVVGSYKKMETTVVDNYKKLETGIVSVYQKLEDKFVDAFLAAEGESTAAAKARVLQNAEQQKKEHAGRHMRQNGCQKKTLLR